MSITPTAQAVRGTLLHYAQLSAQMARERAKAEGSLFVDAQCRKCGLFHADYACSRYIQQMQEIGE